MPKGFIITIYLLLFSLFTHSQSNNTWSTASNYFGYTDKLSGTGIEKIYVFQSLAGVELTFSTNASVVRFYKYATSISEKEPIPSSDISSTASGGTATYTIRNVEDSRAYFAEIDGGSSPVIWVVDYGIHHPQLDRIYVNENNNNCQDLQLVIDKADDLYFYANNGAPHRVVRKYDISYETLGWNAEQHEFVNKTIADEGIDIGTDWPVEAPLTDTKFKISGDQFAKYFGLNFSLSSDTYTAIRTEAHIYAELIKEDGTTSTEIENVELSAPAEIFFYGNGDANKTEDKSATHFYVWNIYKEDDPGNYIVRYTDRDIRYTFKEAGKYIVKLETSDQYAHCPDSAKMQISISDFELKAPGYIILNGTHKFRATKYKSIFNFKCTIFNRWGNKIHEFRDPSEGWDGTYKGRLVSTGVYYYVMTFESGDGKKHEKSGAINALRPK